MSLKDHIGKVPRPYYMYNSTLKLIVVDTVSGNKEYRVNCKKINGKYYVKGIDVLWDGTDWKVGKLTYFDHEIGKDVTSKLHLIEGIVSVVDGVEKKGLFSRNPYNNCIVVDNIGGHTVCMNHAMLDSKYYIENLSTGVYYRIAEIPVNVLRRYSNKGLAINNGNNPYNLMDAGNEFIKMNSLYEKYDAPIDKDLKYIAQHIKDFTFGIELETINGTLPEYIRNRNGIIICKDGSIRDGDMYPPEYVTIPMKGAKGLQTLRNVSSEIRKRSDISHKCSYHIHLGGFTIDRLLMVSLFHLCRKIQNDIFKMFPFYKTNEVKYAGKEKNYCKKLPNVLNPYISGNFSEYVNDTYGDIYSFLTGGKTFDKQYNMRSKINPWGGHKWDIKSRYYWVNFINPVFGKQDTIEFRIHTPTLNSDKIINWLLICAAIIGYAQNNTKLCIQNNKISIEDVLNYYKENKPTSLANMLSKNLIRYYNERVEYFSLKSGVNNPMCDEELLEDDRYKFKLLDIS